MPYYRWRGVNSTASYQKGRLFAATVGELERLLLHRGIALTRAKTERSFIYIPISQSQIIDFLKQVSVLLQSGILLPEALTITAEQTAHTRMQKILFDTAHMVSKGIAFSEALDKNKSVFSSVIVHMIRVGEESGCIASAIDTLVVYLETAQSFKKKLTSAAMMPCITLGAFFCIAAGVIIGIVPRFAHLFRSMGKELPEITQKLISISDALQSLFLWFTFVGISVCLFLAYRLFKIRLKPYIDAFILRVPIINTLVVNSSVLYWLYAVSMLLKNGVPLVPAVRIAHPLVQHTQLKESLADIADTVSTGSTLRFAMINTKMQPFSPEVLALIQVGQESGKLAQMIEKAGMVYHAKVDRVLRFCTFIIQPLLLVIMGLLVAFLVFALYMPIFNMAQIG